MMGLDEEEKGSIMHGSPGSIGDECNMEEFDINEGMVDIKNIEVKQSRPETKRGGGP